MVEAEVCKKSDLVQQAVVRRRPVPKVTEHHSRAEDHGSWIRLICTHEILSNMTTTRFKKRIFLWTTRVISSEGG